MDSFGKSTVFALISAVVAGAVLAACARDEVVYRGSLKDEPSSASEAPTSRSAAFNRPQRAALRRSVAPVPADEEAQALAAMPQRNMPSQDAPRGADSSAAGQALAPVATADPAVSKPTARVQPFDKKSDTTTESPPEKSGPAPATGNALLIEQGRNFFLAGKVLEARKRFILALNGLSPDATLALARTFDTYYLSRLASSDGAPDMQRAVQLYQSAVERGSVDARIDLERTRATLGLMPQ